MSVSSDHEISVISLKVNDTDLGKWLLPYAVQNAEGTLYLC
jgi:hypothetical protein